MCAGLDANVCCGLELYQLLRSMHSFGGDLLQVIQFGTLSTVVNKQSSQELYCDCICRLLLCVVSIEASNGESYGNTIHRLVGWKPEKINLVESSTLNCYKGSIKALGKFMKNLIKKSSFDGLTFNQ